jgi:hypothetical protein
MRAAPARARRALEAAADVAIMLLMGEADDITRSQFPESDDS